MDIASIIGIAGGFASLVFSVLSSGGGLGGIWDLASLIFVIVCSFFAMFLSFPMNRVLGMFKIMGRIFKVPDFGGKALVQNMVALSEKARREGILALEEGLEDLEDAFMKSGLRLVVDGTDGAVIRTIMENELNRIEGRHMDWNAMIVHWAGLGPSYGMMGTVIGLIGMLGKLEDKSSIGPNMAVALVTTLYGSLLANMFLAPFSAKLAYQNSLEIQNKEMIIEGVLSIQAGDNPRILAMKLLTYLDPQTRKALEADVLKD